MNRILWKEKSDKTNLMMIFIEEGNENAIFFDSYNFKSVKVREIEGFSEFKELEYSKKINDKSKLLIDEIKIGKNEVFYIKLMNDDILEIKVVMSTNEEINQSLYICKRKRPFNKFKKNSRYDIFVLQQYEKITKKLFLPF